VRRIRSLGFRAALAAALGLALPVAGQAQQGEDPVELHNKANELQSAGRYVEAIPYARLALEIEERRSGPNYPNVALLLNNLALLYHKQGRYADAEPLYLRSLAIEENALGPDHPEVAKSLNNLGDLYSAQSRYADAEPLHKRSLVVREKTLGPDHPDVATSLNSLASLYADQGRYADAEPLYKRSLAIKLQAIVPAVPCRHEHSRAADAWPRMPRRVRVRCSRSPRSFAARGRRRPIGRLASRSRRSDCSDS
jgi:tetratricopeptide (TPR) repeat protein